MLAKFAGVGLEAALGTARNTQRESRQAQGGDADGLPQPEIFVEDKLHMNAAGYAIWKEVVGPFLKE